MRPADASRPAGPDMSCPAERDPSRGAVKVRVLGDMPGIADALRVIRAAAQAAGFEITDQTRPHLNHREPGYRVYITLRLPPDDTTESRGAAHRRQAIRRPAAPSRSRSTQEKR